MLIHEISVPTLIVKSPRACNRSELDAFFRMVVSTGEVQASGLRNRINEAHVLAFLLQEGRMIGAAAIKYPNESYRDMVFHKAGVEHPELYNYELGWLVVDPAFRGRGLSETLIHAALKRVQGKVFATSAANNAATARINRKVGLLPAGQPYAGSGGRQLILYTIG